MIPRILPEWGIAGLTLVAALALGLTGDQRLGVYLLWVPGVSLSVLTLSWSILFAALGLAQILVLVLCRWIGVNADGACGVCPIADTCRMRHWRPRLALLGAAVWGAMAWVLYTGDAFALPAAMAGALAVCEFCLFTILSSHVPWIPSIR